ncbi:MAG: UDP-N-acetylmuramoyl-L-alanine--D-glutamate ligase [Candidatus Saccharimonadales bacterium]
MRVAIAGYGVEGEANYAYWSDLGHDVTIVDEKQTPDKPVPPGAKALLGEGAFQKLHDFDLVVRTASLPPEHIKTDGKIWSSTNEFFDKCPAPIIGVTGTKGKGTTSSLIASILKQAGQTVHLLGNIGTPALSVLGQIHREDIVVYELSSFQLWDLTMSPHVAVVLMIEPDHLDIHFSLDDYIKAKTNIRKHQTADDICFYHPTNPHSAKIAKSTVLGEIERYAHVEKNSAYAKDGFFYVHGDKVCPISALQIHGAHNIENACAAISAARVFTVDNMAIERGLHDFTGLPHRLRYVRKVDEVTYYDDSIGTTGGSAIAAMNAFWEPKVMILGGSDKGGDYRELAKAIAGSTSIRSIILVGSNADKIHKALAEEKVVAGVTVKGAIPMNEVVATAKDRAQPGDVVILSPASASFDQYKSYSDRGDQFIAAVESL